MQVVATKKYVAKGKGSRHVCNLPRLLTSEGNITLAHQARRFVVFIRVALGGALRVFVLCTE